MLTVFVINISIKIITLDYIMIVIYKINVIDFRRQMLAFRTYISKITTLKIEKNVRRQ